MRTKLGYSQVFMRLPMLRKMPFILRNGDFKVTVTHIPRGKRTTVVNIELGNTLDRLFWNSLRYRNYFSSSFVGRFIFWKVNRTCISRKCSDEIRS